jgi:hypothetical protein
MTRALVLAALATTALGCTLKDLRPDGFQRSPSTAEEARGRELLTKMADAHGLERFEASGRVQIVIDDDWSQARFPTGLSNPFGAEHVRVKMEAAPGSEVATLQLPDGRIWGADGLHAFEVSADGHKAWVEDDRILRTVKPISFFFLAPYRLESARTVFAAGQQEVNGRVYDKVFVTWGEDGEPTDGVAHYLFWIDAETHLLGFVEFAPRILGRVAQVEYADLREVEGLVLPHQLTLVDGVGGPIKIHQMKVRDVHVEGSTDPHLAGDADVRSEGGEG